MTRGSVLLAMGLVLIATLATLPAQAQVNGTWAPGFGPSYDPNAWVITAIRFESFWIVAGQFTEFGGVAATSVARWDGTRWSDMGQGLRGESIGWPRILTLAVYKGTLIAGGSFMTDAGTSIAQWNGKKWVQLGAPGIDSEALVPVHTLTVYGGDSQVGTPPARRPEPTVVVGLLNVTDDRSNKESLGAIPKTVVGTGVMDWLHGGLESLSSFGYRVEDPAPPNPSPYPGIGLEVSCTRLFCTAQPQLVQATLMLRVRFYSAGMSLGEKLYRGAGSASSNNPFGADSFSFSAKDVQKALNGAMDNVVAQIETDVWNFHNGG